MKFKIDKFNKNKSGIYIITNTQSQKIYIGSAVNFFKRFKVHLCTLKKGSHDNNHLQKSFLKYGEDAFEFSDLELVEDLDSIVKREQFYLDIYFGENCYNIQKEAISSFQFINNKKKKDYVLVDPFETVVEYKNCFVSDVVMKINKVYEIKVSSHGLHSILKEKTISHKGWRLVKNKNYDYQNWRKYKKNYSGKEYDVKLLSPTGQVFGPIKNIAKFSKEYNIGDASLLHNLIAGRTRYVNGWSLFNGSYKHPLEKSAKIYDVKVLSPSGETFGPIENLTKFCREHLVNITGMQNLVNKKLVSYKNWTLVN